MRKLFKDYEAYKSGYRRVTDEENVKYDNIIFLMLFLTIVITAIVISI